MKAIILALFLFFCHSISAQSIELKGVYTTKSGYDNTLWLFTENYTSIITYQDDKYLSTSGGPYNFDGKYLQILIEYNDAYPNTIGNTISLPTFRTESGITIDKINLSKLPAHKQGLDGLWRITGRQNAERVVTTIPRSDRKTIKILVDGYFQWIAINPTVKGFYGTGGGEYTFKDGDYSENILFFSRDNTRVGNVLNFKGEVKYKDWHHSGLSSKGAPIYEIWSLD